MAGGPAKLALTEAYLRTHLLRAVLTRRSRIVRWQQRRIEALRRHAVTNTAFYRRLRDVPFSSFPVVDKAIMMGEYSAFNVLNLSASDAWQLVNQGETLPGYDLGCSTGTSGNRGLYLVSDRERFVWLGTVVAKAIPDVLRRRHKVAIVLPRTSRLYDAANESNLMQMRFFELGSGLEAVARDIESFQPTILVGPPRALLWIAETGKSLRPEHVYSCAEVLDEPDRLAIEAAFSLRLGQIYMATEGLFAVSCAHGTLHLAEDVLHFEFEQVSGVTGLVSPIVTDFTRRVQVLARYRLNDLLRLSSRQCQCGSALQAVDEVVGRNDDCFLLPSRNGNASVSLTPDVLRNAVVATDRKIGDFRIRQTSANTIELVLPLMVSDDILISARQNLIAACKLLDTEPDLRTRRETLHVDPATKLRRVERLWKGSHS